MIFTWGAQRQQRRFSSVDDHYCPQCAKDQPSTVVLNYTVRHMWFLLRWVTGKSYHAVCNVCQAVAGRLNTKTFEAKLKKKPIPFFDRLGWLVILGALAALVPVAVVYESVDKKNDLALLNAPRVGDVYEIDFGPDSSATCADCKYGTALVSQVDDKGVYVHLSKQVYNKYSSASSFATGSRARNPDDYLPETYFMPKAKLAEMRQNGDMMDVDR